MNSSLHIRRPVHKLMHWDGGGGGGGGGGCQCLISVIAVL